MYATSCTWRNSIQSFMYRPFLSLINMTKGALRVTWLYTRKIPCRCGLLLQTLYWSYVQVLVVSFLKIVLLLLFCQKNIFLAMGDSNYSYIWSGASDHSDAVWPDLAKFRHFSNISKSLVNFVFGNLNLLWQFLCYWANFNSGKSPNIEQII